MNNPGKRELSTGIRDKEGIMGAFPLVLRMFLSVLFFSPIFSNGVCLFQTNQQAPKSARVPEPKLPFAPERYICYRTLGQIDVNGELSEPSWKNSEWSKAFSDIEGPLKPKPTFQTRVKMLWDEDFFYIGAELEDPHLWATLTKRDSIIFMDNDFEVFIDPTGDTHKYYELEINALGTVWDLFLVKPYRDGGPALHSWDIQGLKSAVSVKGTINNPSDTDAGWSIELAIPWEVLKECAPEKRPPQPGDQWRVNFSRVEWTVKVEEGQYTKVKDPSTGKTLAEDNWVWSPQGLVNMHYPEMWGYVQFSNRPVGSDDDPFEERVEEKVKWALRRIYYRQWAYRNEHGSFANSLADLGLEDLEIKGFVYPPEVKTTWSIFEAVYKNKSGESWHIVADGCVWKE